MASGDLSIILLTFDLRNIYFHVDFTAQTLGEDHSKLTELYIVIRHLQNIIAGSVRFYGNVIL